MKKLLFMFVMIMAVVFAGCSKDDDPTLSSISLDKTTLSIQIEDTYQFEVTFSPNNVLTPAYEWGSNNSDVVTISNTGKMTATGTGTAIITVSVVGDVLKSTCSVTVTRIEATSIQLSATNIELYVTRDSTITATLSPLNATNSTIIWSSSDEAIATVGDGKILAISKGTATIYAKSHDAKVSAECQVIVTDVPVSSVAINELSDGKEILLGDAFQLTYSVMPDDAFNKEVAITSSNESVVKIGEDFKLHALAIGSATIIISSKDGFKSEQYEVNVTDITEFIGHSGYIAISGDGGFSNGYLTATYTPELRNYSNQSIEVSYFIILSGHAESGQQVYYGRSPSIAVLKPGDSFEMGDVQMMSWYKPIFRWTIIWNNQEYTFDEQPFQ